MAIRKPNQFEQGILYAAGILAAAYDKPSIAAGIVVDAGLGSLDIRQMDDTEKQNLALLANEHGINFKTV